MEHLKVAMKKDASLLEYVPLEDIEIKSQSAVPKAIPRIIELGTVPANNGSHSALVACMAASGNTTKTDGGIPRILFFKHGSAGLSDRESLTAREISRLNTMNATFAPTNANPDILNAAIKYVFLAKGVQMSDDIKILNGFARALGQACRAWKNASSKKAKSGQEDEDATPTLRSATASPAESVSGDADEPEMSDGFPGIEDIQDDLLVPSPANSNTSDNHVDHDLSSTHSADSADTEDTEVSRSSTKRDIDEYRETLYQKEDADVELRAFDAANALWQMSHGDSRKRLLSSRQSEHEEVDAKYDVTLEALRV